MQATQEPKPVFLPYARPECMATLALIPPYTMNDVKQAYQAKVRKAHPDAGGDTTTFIAVQKAFEQATDYVVAHTFTWSRIAEAVDIYRMQQALIEELRKYGAEVEVEATGWLVRSWGEDFAKLTERIVAIRLQGGRITDEVLDILLRQPVLLARLRRLDLSHSKITDRGLRRLRCLPSLKQLNLSGTAIHGGGLDVLKTLPELRTVDISESAVGWGTRMRLRWSYRGLQIVSARPRRRRFGLWGGIASRLSLR